MLAWREEHPAHQLNPFPEIWAETKLLDLTPNPQLNKLSWQYMYVSI